MLNQSCGRLKQPYLSRIIRLLKGINIGQAAFSTALLPAVREGYNSYSAEFDKLNTKASPLNYKLNGLLDANQFQKAAKLILKCETPCVFLKTAETTLLGLVSASDWECADRLLTNWSKVCKSPLEAKTWHKLLHRCTGAQEPSIFIKYFQKYKAAGHLPGAIAYTSMMLWMIKHRNFTKVSEPFHQISNPDFYAYKTYLEGLLKGGLVQEAKETFFKLINDGNYTDVVNCNFLLKRLGEIGDFEAAKAVITCMMQKGIPFDSATIPNLALSIQSLEDLEWIQSLNFSLNHDCILKIMDSPFSNEKGFDFTLVVKLAQMSSITLERSFFRRLAQRFIGADCDEQMKILEYCWNSYEESILTSAILEIGKEDSSNYIGIVERVLQRALETGTISAERMAKITLQALRNHHRFSIYLAEDIIKRLLFQAKFPTVFLFVEELFESAQMIISSKLCYLIFANCLDYGFIKEGRQFLDLIRRINSSEPALSSALLYGEHHFGSNRPLNTYKGNVDRLDAREYMNFVSVLFKLKRYSEAKEALHKWPLFTVNPKEWEQLALFKLTSFSIVGDLASFMVLVREINSSAQTLCEAIIQWEEGQKFRLSMQLANNKTNLAIANAFFLLSSRLRNGDEVVEILNELFGPNRLSPNAQTFKAYMEFLLKNSDLPSKFQVSPLDILHRMDEAKIFVNMDLYHKLIAYATQIGDFDQVNHILDRLLKTGGLPNRVIFSNLFIWVREKGDLLVAMQLFDMMERSCVKPTKLVFETIVVKNLEIGALDEAAKWIEKSSQEKETMISGDVASEYFQLYYCNHTLLQCEQELERLLRQGFHISGGGDFYTHFFQRAVDKGDIRLARLYFNRLTHQRIPVGEEKYYRLVNMYFEVGSIDGAHQIFCAMKVARDPNTRSSLPKSFGELLNQHLNPLVDKHGKDFLKNVLRPPALTQQSYCAQDILDFAIRRSLLLSEAWCQRVFENLISRGDFALASNLQMYMTVKGIQIPQDLASKVINQWRMMSKG